MNRSGKRYLLLGALALLAAAGAWWVARGARAPQVEPSVPRVERQEYAPVSGPLEFPEKVRQAPAEVREAYEFAARRPDVIKYMPCFCGCWREEHRSNYDCFIDEVHADGRVDIDDMGFT